jgi:hypothetical protein
MTEAVAPFPKLGSHETCSSLTSKIKVKFNPKIKIDMIRFLNPMGTAN